MDYCEIDIGTERDQMNIAMVKDFNTEIEFCKK